MGDGLTDIPETLTFDDVLLEPGYSEVLPTQVDVQTQLCAGLKLQIPIISAAMDTVTEGLMARVMAQLGGLGVIHRNLSVEDQCQEVQKVKQYESGLVTHPLVLPATASIKQAWQLMQQKQISGIPIVDDQHRLLGLVTYRDLRFLDHESESPLGQVMTPRQRLVVLPAPVDWAKARALLQEYRLEKLPVVDGQDRLVGLITVKDLEKARQYPHATKDDQGRLRVAAAVGVGTDNQHRVAQLVRHGVDLLVVDTAHGHSRGVLDMVRWIRQEYPHVWVMAGNVATPQGVEALAQAGAHVVKVGVGPGSICTTRIVAGVGVAQWSAIWRCAPVARQLGVGLVADGGIRFSGDITKALAAGAHAVMIGQLLAGTDEAPGELFLYQGRAYKTYRGMGSLGAMITGSRDRYGQGQVSADELIPEGVEARVPYRGPVARVIHQLVGGLRAGMGYVGAKNLGELVQKARWVRITAAGWRESHVHDVQVLKEAPNYHQLDRS